MRPVRGDFMKRMARLMLHCGGQLERENVIWNTVGSFLYALANMVLAFLVIRMAGEDAGGVFAIGFSTFGQQMFTVSYYGLRPFHITDSGADQGGYSFGEYYRHRQFTAAAAVLFAGLYAFWRTGGGLYAPEKAAAVFMLAGYKIIDGFADVYESEFQRQGCLYLTGKSVAFRTVLAAGTFLLVLGTTGNLLAACPAALLAQIAGVILFDVSIIHRLGGVDFSRRRGSAAKIFARGGLLFFSVFLDFYIFSAARYAIDRQMNDAASGYFNLIFMPTSVIYLVANFVIRPVLTRMTVCWNHGDLGGFLAVIRRISLLIGGLTALAVGGTLLLGRFVLTVMEIVLGSGYTGALTDYVPAFAVIVLGGGIYAFGNLLYYSLVIMRLQKKIFCVYVVVAVDALWLSRVFVERMGINGGAAAYCLFMMLQTAGFGICVFRECVRRGKG